MKIYSNTTAFDPYDINQVDPLGAYYEMYYGVWKMDISRDMDDPDPIEAIIVATESEDEAFEVAKQCAREETDENIGYQVVIVKPDINENTEQVSWFVAAILWSSWDY